MRPAKLGESWQQLTLDRRPETNTSFLANPCPAARHAAGRPSVPERGDAAPAVREVAYDRARRLLAQEEVDPPGQGELCESHRDGAARRRVALGREAHRPAVSLRHERPHRPEPLIRRIDSRAEPELVEQIEDF